MRGKYYIILGALCLLFGVCRVVEAVDCPPLSQIQAIPFNKTTLPFSGLLNQPDPLWVGNNTWIVVSDVFSNQSGDGAAFVLMVNVSGLQIDSRATILSRAQTLQQSSSMQSNP